MGRSESSKSNQLEFKRGYESSRAAQRRATTAELTKDFAIRCRVEEVAHSRGMTLYALEAASGISYQTLLRLKSTKAKQIDFDTMLRLMLVLRCDANALFEMVEKDGINDENASVESNAE